MKPTLYLFCGLFFLQMAHLLPAQTAQEVDQIAIKAIQMAESSPRQAFKMLDAQSQTTGFQTATTAQSALAYFHYHGVGTFPDQEAGLKYWRQAVELGDRKAAFDILVHHDSNFSWSRQVKEERLKCARMAAEENIPYAMGRYGYFLFYGRGGAKKDRDEGMRLIKEGALENDPYSCYLLGSFYRFGTGVSANAGTAFGLMETAAKGGRVEAMLALQEMYRAGVGTRQDCGMVVYWLEKAAEKNSSEAQFKLGELFYEGQCGRPKNTELARSYFSKAAEQGHQKANAYLAEIDAPPPVSSYTTGGSGQGSASSLTYDALIDLYLRELNSGGLNIETHGTVDARGRHNLAYRPYASAQEVALVVNEGTRPGYFPSIKLYFYDSDGDLVGTYQSDASEVVRHNDYLTSVKIRIQTSSDASTVVVSPSQGGYLISAFD